MIMIIMIGGDAAYSAAVEGRGPEGGDVQTTVGFHNFNLRIVNLRVSNPNKLIVDVFLTRCRISMCQGLGPKKHYEISEIDHISYHARSSRIIAYQIINYQFIGILLYTMTLQYGIVQCNLVQYIIAQYNIVEQSIVQYSLVQHRARRNSWPESARGTLKYTKWYNT